MHIPLSIYRIQFNPSFGFNHAKEIIRYLNELGISDIYASPIFKAKGGSQHGYDVVDPNQLNPELGGFDEFESLINKIKKYSMGWLQDIVPNHMAYDVENQMLMNVLEYGEGSEYFDYFDVEWDHPYESIRGRFLAPFLGRFYGECLEDGEIQLRYGEHGLTINYYELSFPLRRESYNKVYTCGLNRLEERLGGAHHDFIKLIGILHLQNTPKTEDKSCEGYDQIKLMNKMLWELYSENDEIKRYLDENIETFNGKRGDADSFNLLDDLLSEQLFRLSFWKVAAEETNYRRFFNINGLISLRVEDENVFNYTHTLISQLVAEGKINGLRIDHVDGLYDPTVYLQRLREKNKDVYIVVEKILDHNENLPSLWPVQGTTGYDFMNYVNGIFCEKSNDRHFHRIYSKYVGLRTSFENLVYEKKRLIIDKEMAGDVDNLANLMKKISGRFRYSYDVTLHGLKRALVEVLTVFPVYRTYINFEDFSKIDQIIISEVIKKAKKLNPDLLYELNFIEMFLHLNFGENVSEEEKNRLIHFVMRFQQFTGPLMAKGFEDTTLYVYNRFLSLNEVGGSPDKFGISMVEFHNFNKERSEHWPHTINATSTHDIKRGEDVRARLNVLSEIPKEWNVNIREWNKLNRRRKKLINEIRAPDKNDEYFLYQTLIGTFPFPEPGQEQVQEEGYFEFIERIKNYIIKAVREAKVHTAWLKPDEDYENAYAVFVERILKTYEENAFLKSFIPVKDKIAFYGIFNSLSQVILKITSPGVPDFYQGTELWDLNLVDPDNRRPVDFLNREKYLKDIKDREKIDIIGLINELLSTKEDGKIKLFLVYRALKARRENIGIFQNGDYIPVEIKGRYRENIVSFARKDKNSWSITVAPRFFVNLIEKDKYPFGEEVWEDTHIVLPDEAPIKWKDAITDKNIEGEGILSLGEILSSFPVSLLISE